MVKGVATQSGWVMGFSQRPNCFIPKFDMQSVHHKLIILFYLNFYCLLWEVKLLIMVCINTMGSTSILFLFFDIIKPFVEFISEFIFAMSDGISVNFKKIRLIWH